MNPGRQSTEERAVSDSGRARVLRVNAADAADGTSDPFDEESFEVVTEACDEDALERLKDDPVDCVVSDHDPPGVDGLALLETVRESHPELPFVLYVGDGSEEVAAEAFSLGADGYVRKDDGASALREQVKSALEERKEESRTLSRAIETSMDGMGVTDKEGVIRYVNRAHVEVYGYDEKDEFVGEHWKMLYDEDTLARFEDEILPELRETGYWRGEVVGVRKDGTEFEQGLSLSMMDDGSITCVVRDITERKRRERELERKHNLLRRTESLARTGGWELDVDEGEGKMRWTDGVYEIFELPSDHEPTVEEIITEFCHPEDEERIREAYRRLRECEDSFDEEFRITTAEGGFRWVHARTDDVPDDETEKVRGAVRDVTELKERDLHLLRRTERLGDTGGYEINTETETVRWTPGACEIYDVPRGYEATGDEALDFCHPDDEERVREAVEEWREGGVAFDEEYRIVTAEGRERWIRVQCEPLSEDNTKAYGAVSDVTGRKERERELRVRTRAMEKTDVPLTITDPNRPDNPLVYVNEGFEEMTGYDEDEAVGRNCRFLQGEDTDPEKTEEIQRALEDEEPVEVELLNYTKDGEPFWNNLRISPIYDDKGELVHYLGTQRDVTDRRERREALAAANRRLDVLYETVDRMVSATSKDRVRELIETAPEELGHTSEYYVWREEVGSLVSASGSTAEEDDNLVWKAYVSGEERADEGVVAVPMAHDGVLGVREDEAETGPDGLEEFAASLAASAEAALSRIETRSEALELSETLEERQERLETMNEIDDALREMTSRVSDENDRRAMEEAACEALVGVDDWDFAWIASPTAEGREVRASTDPDFADALCLALEDETNLLTEAASACEPCLVDSVAGEPGSDWRRTTLDGGYLSVATVPVTNSGRTYGVLQVYSEETDAFSDAYADALGDAAEILGYAVASAERGMSADGAVRLTISVPEARGPVPRLAEETGKRLFVESHVPSDEGDGYNVYVSPEEGNAGAMLDLMSLTPAEATEDGAVRLKAHDAPFVERAAERGGRLRACWHDGTDFLLRIDLPTTEDARGFVDDLTEEYPTASVVSYVTEPVDDGRRNDDPLSALTDRQAEAIETAYYEGFFDSPRDATGEVVADELGVSPSTLHQHLRTAERKILSSLLGS